MAWGAWSGLGEAEEQRARIESQLASVGIHWIVPEHGMAAFDRLIRENRIHSMILPVDWSRYQSLQTVPLSLLSELSLAEEVAAVDRLARRFVTAFEQAGPEASRALLTQAVGETLQSVLSLSALPDPQIGIFDLGMDSLMAVELRTRLNRLLGGKASVPNTLAFDYPEVDKLTDYLAVALDIGSAQALLAAPRLRQGGGDEPIAIVGQARRFPNAEDTRERFGNSCQLVAMRSQRYPVAF